MNSFHFCEMQQLSIMKFTIIVRDREDTEIEGGKWYSDLNNTATAVLKK